MNKIMTPEYLRYIATYLDMCDAILDRLESPGSDYMERVHEISKGKEVQADLRYWADCLESDTLREIDKLRRIYD